MNELKSGLIYDTAYGNAIRVRVITMVYPNDRTAICLISDDHVREPVATLTCNLPQYPLAPGEFFVKDYSENEGAADWLVRQGIAEATGESRSSGFVSIPVMRFTPAIQSLVDSFKH